MLKSRMLLLGRSKGAAVPVAPGPSWALYLLNEGSGQTVGDSSGNGRDLWLGFDGNADSTDPTWTTLSGVACLEFAGTQICYVKSATVLAQPYTMIALARSTAHTSVAVIVTKQNNAGRGLARVATTKALRLQVDTALVDGVTPDATWFAGIGVAKGVSSKVWISGGAVTSGDAGTFAISSANLGGRLTGSAPPVQEGWQGQIAAAVILAEAASESLAEAWVTYLKAVKGVA